MVLSEGKANNFRNLVVEVVKLYSFIEFHYFPMVGCLDSPTEAEKEINLLQLCGNELGIFGFAQGTVSRA